MHGVKTPIIMLTVKDKEIDKVLGLDIENYVGFEVPQKIVDLAKVRQDYRRSGIWDKADMLRRQIEDAGFIV